MRLGAISSLAAVLVIGAVEGRAGMADIKLYGQFGTGTPAIEGNFVEDLTSASAFPDNPALDSANPPDFFPIEPITSLEWPQPFQEGDNTGDDYGSMVEGYLEVPADGEYQFYIRSDDGSQFELSSDDSASSAEVVAEVPGDACCSAFVTDGTRNSDPITLQKGEQYYFRVLHKEGTGGDWWQVGWSGPEIGDDPTVIAGRYIQRYVTESGAPVITQQPENQSIPEEEIATTDAVFSVAVDAAPPVDYQWLENGEPIDGAISSSYSFQASLEDDGNEYSVEISNGDGSVTSEIGTLTVTPDTTSPTLVEANHRGNPNGVRVRFSEPVDEASATNLDNYTLDGGSLEITSAELVEDGRAVQLGGDWNFELESSHTIEVSGVTDRAATPNEISPSPASANFTFAGGEGVTYDFNEGLPDNLEVYGSAEVRSSGSYDGSGFLSVNDGEGSQLGAALFTDRLDINQVKFTFKMRIADTSDNPADGFSFNVADDLPEGTYPQSEEGYNATTDTVDADGLMVAFDNWDSGGNDNSPSVAVKYEGEVKGEVELPGAGSGEPIVEEIDGRELPSIHRGDEWFDVEIDVRPDGTLFMTYDGYTIFDGLQTGFDGIQNAQVGFGGRTGGAWQTHWIDDLNVNFEGGEVGPIAIAEGEQPEDKLDVPEHEQVTFDVVTSGSTFGLSFQWMKDGEPIEGATSRALTLTAAPSVAGEYSVHVQNEFSETTSEAATLSVVPDTEPASLVNVHNTITLRDVFVRLSEPVTEASANDAANYSINGPAVQSAQLQDDPSLVLVTFEEELDPGTDYTLTVDGVVDRAEDGNAMSGQTIDFASWRGRSGVRWSAYTGISGTAVSGMTEADKFPFNPDETRIISTFDMGGSGSFFGDNYGARMTALFHPPESGDYRFFVRSDDASQLFLGSEGTFGSLTEGPIAEETGCCNAFQGPGASQTSDVISLSAGEPVLLEYLMKEGGGGDWAQVAYRMEGDGTNPADLSPIPAEELTTAQVDPSKEGPPMVTDITGSPSLRAVRLNFSEPLTQASASETGNYSIDGLFIDSVSVNSVGTEVIVQTDEQDPGARYMITLNGLTDFNGEEIGADTTVEFASAAEQKGGLKRYFFPYSGNFVTDVYVAPPDRDNSGQVPEGWEPFGDDPGQSSTTVNIFESGRDVADNYGGIMQGWIEAPATGDYTFYVSSDDNSQLWLSTDEDPANTAMIANEPQWNGYRAWNVTDRRNADDPENVSDPISLEEGQRYYVEAVFNEGGTGDGMEVTWQLPGEDPPADGDPSIAGEHLISVLPLGVGPEVISGSQSPAPGADNVGNFSTVSVTLKDGAATVDDESIEMMVDGNSVTPTVSRDDNLVTIEYTPGEDSPLSSFTDIPVSISYMDSSGNQQSVEWSFGSALHPATTFVDGTRFIEAEDYNYESGQWVEGANGGPTGEAYAGGEYEGLEGVNGVDFNDGGGGGGEPAYRFDVATDVPGPATVAFEEPEDLDRGSFEVESNWKVGWTGEGEWLNFTRDFPVEEQTYDVYARISSGGTDPNPTLQRVTGDPTQEDQSVVQLGQFSGAASGDWGTAIFYKMHEIDNPDAPAQVSLSGENTIRLTVGTGNMDWDYLAFVPAEPIGPGGTELSISFADGNVEVSWDTGATLQTAPSVTGPWEDNDQSSPASFSVDDSDSLFIRAVE